MITPRFVYTMARYNAWQNRSLYSAADGLSDADRKLDRGAFFDSIHRTLCHVLWGDTIWMSRLDDWQPPAGGIDQSADLIADWATLTEARAAADQRILTWAEGVSTSDIAETLHWYSGAAGRDVSMPLEICITHFFNHQTHHRGQVHAMLTATGASPDDTDLFMMPEVF